MLCNLFPTMGSVPPSPYLAKTFRVHESVLRWKATMTGVPVVATKGIDMREGSLLAPAAHHLARFAGDATVFCAEQNRGKGGVARPARPSRSYTEVQHETEPSHCFKGSCTREH